jgi:hypothetical protein
MSKVDFVLTSSLEFKHPTSYHTAHLRVLYGSQNKQQLFPHMALIHFYDWKKCLLRGTNRIFEYKWDTGHQQWRPGFDHRTVHWNLLGMKCHWDRFFSEHFSFPLSIPFYQCSMFFPIYMLLSPKGYAGEHREPAKSNAVSEVGNCTRVDKYFQFFS